MENNTHIPFIGGAVGYLSYDLGNYIEKLPQTAKKDLDVYDLYFGFYDYVIVVDHLEEKTYIATPDLDLKKEADIAFVVECKISEAEINGVNPICYEKKEVPPTRLTSNFTKKEFEDGVEKVRQ